MVLKKHVGPPGSEASTSVELLALWKLPSVNTTNNMLRVLSHLVLASHATWHPAVPPPPAPPPSSPSPASPPCTGCSSSCCSLCDPIDHDATGCTNAGCDIHTHSAPWYCVAPGSGTEHWYHPDTGEEYHIDDVWVDPNDTNNVQAHDEYWFDDDGEGDEHIVIEDRLYTVEREGDGDEYWMSYADSAEYYVTNSSTGELWVEPDASDDDDEHCDPVTGDCVNRYSRTDDRGDEPFWEFDTEEWDDEEIGGLAGVTLGGMTFIVGGVCCCICISSCLLVRALSRRRRRLRMLKESLVVGTSDPTSREARELLLLQNAVRLSLAEQVSLSEATTQLLQKQGLLNAANQIARPVQDKSKQPVRLPAALLFALTTDSAGQSVPEAERLKLLKEYLSYGETLRSQGRSGPIATTPLAVVLTPSVLLAAFAEHDKRTGKPPATVPEALASLKAATTELMGKGVSLTEADVSASMLAALGSIAAGAGGGAPSPFERVVLLGDALAVVGDGAGLSEGGGLGVSVVASLPAAGVVEAAFACHEERTGRKAESVAEALDSLRAMAEEGGDTASLHVSQAFAALPAASGQPPAEQLATLKRAIDGCTTAVSVTAEAASRLPLAVVLAPSVLLAAFAEHDKRTGKPPATVPEALASLKAATTELMGKGVSLTEADVSASMLAALGSIAAGAGGGAPSPFERVVLLGDALAVVGDGAGLSEGGGLGVSVVASLPAAGVVEAAFACHEERTGRKAESVAEALDSLRAMAEEGGDTASLHVSQAFAALPAASGQPPAEQLATLKRAIDGCTTAVSATAEAVSAAAKDASLPPPIFRALQQEFAQHQPSAPTPTHTELLEFGKQLVARIEGAGPMLSENASASAGEAASFEAPGPRERVGFFFEEPVMPMAAPDFETQKQQQRVEFEELVVPGARPSDQGASAELVLTETTKDAAPMDAAAAQRLVEAAAALGETNAFKQAASVGSVTELQALVDQSLDETEARMQRANRFRRMGRTSKSVTPV